MTQAQHADRAAISERELTELLERIGLTDEEMLSQYRSVVNNMKKRDSLAYEQADSVLRQLA